jgi:hypothetical protein
MSFNPFTILPDTLCDAFDIPALAQCQDISRDYYGTVYAPRRVGAFISSVGGGGGFVFNPLTGRGGAAAQPLVIH